MKRILQLTLMLSLILWGACQKDNLDPLNNFDLTTPQLTAPTSGKSIALPQANGDTVITFSWTAAVASNKFIVQYKVVLDSADNADFSTPILTLTPTNSGRDLTVSATAKQLDYALSLLNYPANASVNLKWGVIASATDKQTIASAPIVIKRFATEPLPDALYIAGTATETGADVTKATLMRSQKNTNGAITHIYDVYTKLTAGATYKFYSENSLPSLTYGGANGTIVKGGALITASETALYRVTVDLNSNKYTLLKIDKWGIVGNGSFTADAALAYQGGGIWQSSLNLINAGTGSFAFLANGDSAYLVKRIQGTTGKVLMVSEAPSAGVTVENVPVDKNGKFIITLNLAADQYTYTVAKDPNAPADLTAPSDLYLLQDGTVISHLTKSGSTFTSSYLALRADKTYTLNSASDGSGTSYTINESIGASSSPTADNVSGSPAMDADNTPISVSTSQAYKLTVDFSTAKLGWQYYNLKMFVWDDPNGGWDTRTENVMTYSDPYTFTVTAQITANFDVKFNSPWDVQFGSGTGGLTGTMTNGGPNFTGITQSGTYTATIVIADDYQSCTYTFVKQ